MNIGPSQRQLERPDPETSETLRLHMRMARRRYWQTRLFACSLAAFGLSLLAWLIGLSWVGHGLMVLLGFALGFLYPLADMPRWALRWIASEAGLSYQTALELEDDDPYGLAERVRERAARTAIKVRPPKTQAWWLPLMALALGLALLPALSVPGPALFGTPAPQEAQNAPSSASSREPQTSETQATEPQGEQANELGSSDAQDQRAEAQGGGGAAQDYNSAAPTNEGTGAGRDIDEETLSRFLDNLRERPENLERSPAQPQALGSEGERSEGQRQQSGQDQGQEREGEAQSGSAESRPGSREGEGEETAQEGADGGEDGADGTEQAGNQAGGETSDAGESQDDTADGEDNGLNPFDPGSGGSQGENQGLEDQEGVASDPGSGAGELSSAERSSDGLDAGAEGELDTLRGRVGAGPVSTAGTAQLPGRRNQTLPQGQTPENYDQAVERAISEGRIPVEYQEIIRNYFR